MCKRKAMKEYKEINGGKRKSMMSKTKGKKEKKEESKEGKEGKNEKEKRK